MPSPSQPTIDRLCKMLGMLGSDHAGERDNAAVKANQIVRELGLTWSQLLRPKAALQPIINQGIPTEQHKRAVNVAQQQGYAQGYRDGLAEKLKSTKAEPAPKKSTGWRGEVRHMRDTHWDDLSKFEKDFCESILRQKRSEPSERQQEVIDRMFDNHCECD